MKSIYTPAKHRITLQKIPAQGETDLIAQIVDRDTPPDNRNEVIDCHANGAPITRGDVARMNHQDIKPYE